ncbi:MAG: phage integrase N-terminal SAM-like domain-containing protein, partial [Candidatus Sulfotelmatobacter sp.]
MPGQRDTGTPSGATYYKRVKRDGEWGWESVGNDANTALSQSHAMPLVVTEAANSKPDMATAKDGYRIEDEVAVYLLNVAKLSPKTYKAYKRSLELFRQSCQKTYIHQITKQDLQAFDTSLIEDGNEDRTRHNRVQHVVTFLRNEEGRR